MALSRSVLAAVVAAVCVVLLACAPVAVAGCTQLLGVSHSEQTFTTAEMDQNNLVYLIGNYELPARVTSTAHYTSFDFKYTVPPQQEPHTVNYVRFAVFDFAESNSPVAQSELLTIRGGVRGNQTVTAHIQGTAGALKPSTPYRIGQRAGCITTTPLPSAAGAALSVLLHSCTRLTCLCCAVGCVVVRQRYGPSTRT